jgi:hypothetical protein
MNAEELIGILCRGEGPRIEFKREFPAQAHAIGKEMAALANTGGGVLLMGVTDNGDPTGIDDADKVVERLAGIAHGCLGKPPEIDKFQLSKNIFLVYAKIRACGPCIYEGRIYHRVGSTSVECKTPQELLDIIEGLTNQNADGPNLVGQKKGTTKPVTKRRRRTNELDFFEHLTRRPQEAIAAKKILDWSHENFTRVKWERTSFVPVLDYGAKSTHNPITVFAIGKIPRVQIKFGHMKKKNGFSEAKRIELLQKLNKIPGVNLKDYDKFPTIKLSVLSNEDALDQFLDALAWTNREVKAVQHNHG